MSKNVQRLECCSVLNEATTHKLKPDNWNRERFIDFATCKICGANLLHKRYTQVNGEYIDKIKRSGNEKKKEKIWREYQELLKCELETYDNEYLRSLNRSGGLVQNVYYARNGVSYRTDHLSTRRQWNGNEWKCRKKVS